MRKEFIETLTAIAEEDERIRFLTADMGFGLIDTFRNRHPERFYNLGCAEQNMIGVAIGMASCGLLPFTYSISAFLTMRPFEFIRHAAHQKLQIRLVGSGRDKDYENEGFTHWALEDTKIMSSLLNIQICEPADADEAIQMLKDKYELPGIIYYRLSRS